MNNGVSDCGTVAWPSSEASYCNHKVEGVEVTEEVASQTHAAAHLATKMQTLHSPHSVEYYPLTVRPTCLHVW